MPRPARKPNQVLAFWFSLERPGRKHDALVRQVLGALYEQAARHRLEHWQDDPRARLALVILLDQVPRHLYRGDARAFATDPEAQQAAARFFERGDWADFTALERYYAALPYLHAEDVARQEQVNPLVHACARQVPELRNMGATADRYLRTIRRFGRFPHRNPPRGIESTPEEVRFLAEEWYPPRRGRAGAAGTWCPLLVLTGGWYP